MINEIDNCSICKKCGIKIKGAPYCWEEHMDSKHPEVKWREEDSEYLSEEFFRDLYIEEIKQEFLTKIKEMGK